MTLVMTQTITESVNGGRTAQEFLKDGTYLVAADIGQRWIGRGWARRTADPATATAPSRQATEPSTKKGKE